MSRKLTHAALFAARHHAGQTRRGGDIPYINHCLSVAAMVADSGADEDVVAAALLHDVVEDTVATNTDLDHTFGPRVAEVVAEVTDDPDWSALSTVERKTKQIGKMQRASKPAKLIKIADQVSNVADLAGMKSGHPADWLEGYLSTSKKIVDVCRDASPDLGHRFDEAATRLSAKIEAMRADD